MTVVLTEQIVAEMAPNPKALLDGRGVVKKGALRKLARSEDGKLVFGLCQGSGSTPYQVSMDFETGGDRPTLRCSCPSRQFPCKHELALMLAYVANGASFPVAEPPADLLEKRAKLLQRAEKKAAPSSEPKKVNKDALARKAQEQSAALDTLETFVLDLVSSGLGGLTSKHLKAIDTQAKRLTDAQLYGASATLQHLSALVSDDKRRARDDDDEEEKKAARGLSEERQARIAALVTQLWVTIRKGRRVLEGKLEEGAAQSEADAQVESILGRRYQLPELRAAGYWVTERNMLELAHEREDDPVTQMASASGYMLDLGDGSVHRELTSLPYRALAFEKLRSSRAGVLLLKEAALYPGDVMNRRLRWEDAQAVERPRAPADYAALHGHARPLDELIKALRGQLKNPLNPTEAVGLLAVQRFGTAGDVLVAEDKAGARLVMSDPRRASFATTRTLRYAAGALTPQSGPVSLAVRLHVDPTTHAVLGQGLALFVGEEHLRLGM